jgi:anti-anti-sigma regulatory factor
MDQRGPNRWALDMREEEANGCRILVLRGRLGFAAAPVLEAALRRLDPGSGVILDFAGVDYASSAALKVLEERARSSPPVIVCGMPEAVRLTFDISGVANGVQLASSRLEAVDRLKRHPID